MEKSSGYEFVSGSVDDPREAERIFDGKLYGLLHNPLSDKISARSDGIDFVKTRTRQVRAENGSTLTLCQMMASIPSKDSYVFRAIVSGDRGSVGIFSSKVSEAFSSIREAKTKHWRDI